MKNIKVTEELYRYACLHNDAPHSCLAELIAETAKLPIATMQISPDQGTLMNMLAKITGAKRTIEVGCFTGYSAISVATALPEDGLLITLDVSDEYTKIARRYFKKSGCDKKIKLVLGSALETIPVIIRDFGPESFDMAFIDADKENMIQYFELCLTLVRRRGLILVDNVLWSGRVVDESDQSDTTKAIRTFNEFSRHDKRIDHCMLPMADGISILRKR